MTFDPAMQVVLWGALFFRSLTWFHFFSSFFHVAATFMRLCSEVKSLVRTLKVLRDDVARQAGPADPQAPDKPPNVLPFSKIHLRPNKNHREDAARRRVPTGL